MNINVVTGLICAVGILAFVLGSLGSKYPNRSLQLFCAFMAYSLAFGIPALVILASYFPERW